MSIERLSGLTLMHLHNDLEIDEYKICHLLIIKNRRRMIQSCVQYYSSVCIGVYSHGCCCSVCCTSEIKIGPGDGGYICPHKHAAPLSLLPLINYSDPPRRILVSASFKFYTDKSTCLKLHDYALYYEFFFVATDLHVITTRAKHTYYCGRNFLHI